MSQRCYSCGRESPLGGKLEHFYGCSVGTFSDAPMTRQMVDDEVLRVLDHYAANVFLPNAGCDGVDLAEARAAVAALQAERDALREQVMLADHGQQIFEQTADDWEQRAERAESALEALRGQVAELVGAAQKFRDAEYARNGTGERLDAFHDARDELDAELLAIKERMA